MFQSNRPQGLICLMNNIAFSVFAVSELYNIFKRICIPCDLLSNFIMCNKIIIMAYLFLALQCNCLTTNNKIDCFLICFLNILIHHLLPIATKTGILNVDKTPINCKINFLSNKLHKNAKMIQNKIHICKSVFTF